jgi:hypothetical protein
MRKRALACGMPRLAGRRRRYVGITLIVAAIVLFLLTLDLAFTIYGELAAVAAVLSLTLCVVLLSRR